MIRKVISLATAIAILDVFLRSQLYSNEPLFLFISANLLVNIGLVLLAGLLVVVSFKKRFRSWWAYAASAAGAVILAAFSLMGLFYSDMDYSLYNVIKPFDYLLLLQAGIILGICALSYKHAKQPAYVNLTALRRAMISRPAGLVLNGLAWLMPAGDKPAVASGKSQPRHA